MVRFNRTNSAPQEIIMVASGNQALATGTLLNGANVRPVDGQFMILSDDFSGATLPNNSITAAQTALQIKALKVIQGTSNSQSLSNVSPFNLNAPAYWESATIEPDKVNSVTSTLPELATYSMKYMSAFTAPTVATDYVMSLVLESSSTEIEYAAQRRDINRYSITMPAVAPTAPTDYLLQTIATKANLQSIHYNAAGKPFIVFGIASDGTPGTVINGITATTSIPWMTYGGVSYSFVSSTTFVKSLQDALAASVLVGTESIVNLNSVAAGSAVTVDALLVVGLDEIQAVVFDDETRNKVRVTVGMNIDNTTAIASAPKELIGGGKAWNKQWKERMGLGIYWEAYLAHPYQGSVNSLTSPITESSMYTSTIIEFYKKENLNVSGDVVVTPHRLTFLLPATVTNPTADVATPYTIATTATTTVTQLNAALGAWLSSASSNFSNIAYQEGAAAATPFI